VVEVRRNDAVIKDIAATWSIDEKDERWSE
jgi:hypothetical protein